MALSELENVVLALIWLRQPCTAYSVRKAFDESLSAHWSSSAGSIYPLLRRLERARLVAAQSLAGDKRGARQLRLTSRGVAAARAWLTPPLPDWSVLIGHDPLRTRVRFLGMLESDAANEFLADARQKLDQAVAEIRKSAKKPETDAFDRLAHRNAELQMLARLRWLNEVEESLTSK